jgi:hypothetical protein
MSWHPNPNVRLILRANREHGGANHCHRCRRPYRRGELMLVGRIGRVGFVVGQCCGAALTELVGGGIAAGARPDSWAEAEPMGSA